MRNNQPLFPIDVRTGWVDFSPALRYYASQRIGARLAAFTSEIRSVTVRISDDAPHKSAQRRCEIGVTTPSGPISASSIGVNLFTLVDRALDTVVEMLRQRAVAEKHDELLQLIA